MFKTIASALAVTTVLALAFAPASASPRHGGFGLAALAIGAVGAVIGAEIVSHSDHEHHANGGCFTRWQPTYDGYGDYVGRRPVQYCD